MSKTFKNIFDKGYTTYHDNGTKSTTYKNVTNDGYTTYHSDGGISHTYKNFLNNGYTTYHSTSGSGSVWGLILALVAVGASVYECGTAIIFPSLILFVILPVIVFVLRRTFIKPIWTIYGYTYFLLSLYPVIMNADITIPIMPLLLCVLFSILVFYVSVIGYGCFLDDTSGILDFIVLFLVVLSFILYIVTKNKSVSSMSEFLIASLTVQVVLILISQIKYVKYAKDIRKRK